MGDAMSDAAKTQDRWDAFADMCFKTLLFLIDTTPYNAEEVHKAAYNCRASFEIDPWLDKLHDGDRLTWARFIIDCENADSLAAYKLWKKPIFRKAKELSPFKADEMLVQIDYGRGRGYVHLYGDLQDFLDRALKQQGLGTYHGEKYYVILPDMNQVEVIE